MSSFWLLLCLIKLPLLMNGAALVWALQRDQAARQRFAERHAGEIFLLFDARRGWQRFIEDHVAPALDGQIRLCPRADGGLHPDAPASDDVWRHLPWLPWQGSAPAPCLVVAERSGLRMVPLRDVLEPLRKHSHAHSPAPAAIRDAVAARLLALPERGRAAVGGTLTPAALPAAR